MNDVVDVRRFLSNFMGKYLIYETKIQKIRLSQQHRG